MTILAPVTKSESSTDPRDPLARLENLFDPGTTVPLHPRDKSGVLAASGKIDGVRTIAYCSDATVMGGAMGLDGCKHLVDAINTAIDEQTPSWGSGIPVAPASLRASKLCTLSDLSSRQWSAHQALSHRFPLSSDLLPAAPRTDRP